MEEWNLTNGLWMAAPFAPLQRVDVSEPHKLGDFAAAMTTADGAELQSVLAERALEV